MKIVIPTNGNNLESAIGKSFGRAQRFLVVDSLSKEFEVIENIQNMESAQGAGIQSAQSAVKAGGDVLVTLNCGPKAYRVLSESGMRVYTGIDDTIEKNIDEFVNNKLSLMNDANKEGHWM